MGVNKDVRFWPMMITVFLGSFVVMLSSSTINIALPFSIFLRNRKQKVNEVAE